MTFPLIVNILALFALLVSYRVDAEKTKKALSSAVRGLKDLAPRILLVIGLIGVYLAFVPPQAVVRFFGSDASLLAALGLGGVGAVAVMPAPVAYPLAGMLKDSGVHLVGIAAFVSALTMVGFLSSPIEADIFGWPMVLVRNAFNLAGVLLVALLIGVVLL